MKVAEVDPSDGTVGEVISVTDAKGVHRTLVKIATDSLRHVSTEVMLDAEAALGDLRGGKMNGAPGTVMKLGLDRWVVCDDDDDPVAVLRGPRRGRPAIGPDIRVRVPEAVRDELQRRADGEGVPLAEIARRILVDGVGR